MTFYSLQPQNQVRIFKISKMALFALNRLPNLKAFLCEISLEIRIFKTEYQALQVHI